MPNVRFLYARICEVCGVIVFDNEPEPHTCDPNMVEVYQIVQTTVEMMCIVEQLAEFLSSRDGKIMAFDAERDRIADAAGKNNQQ